MDKHQHDQRTLARNASYQGRSYYTGSGGTGSSTHRRSYVTLGGNVGLAGGSCSDTALHRSYVNVRIPHGGSGINRTASSAQPSTSAIERRRSDADTQRESVDRLAETFCRTRRTSAPASSVVMPHSRRSVVHVSGGSVDAAQREATAASKTQDKTGVITRQPRARSTPASSDNARLSTLVENENGESTKKCVTFDDSDMIRDTSVASFREGIKGFFRFLHNPFQCCDKKSEEPRRVRHKFRFYQFQRPRICFYCKQQVWHLGSACTVCRYICHRKCELQSPNQAFPDRSMSTDSNGNYGQPYSFDSLGSMSLESMSTSGDRSSKSVSETPDYDMLLEAPPQVPSRSSSKKLDNKPPMSPQKHRHVHVGRGTHGVCDTPQSPARPGSTDTTMTSSLRKSPSFKSGHHVRWGPGVVNSNQQLGGGGQQANQPVINGVQGPPAPKRSKKKTSLRTLLNIPKFPVSDEDFTDYGSDTSYSSKGHSSYSQNSFDQRGLGSVGQGSVGQGSVGQGQSARRDSSGSSGSKDRSMSGSDSVIRAPPARELACLQYMKQFPPVQKDTAPQLPPKQGKQGNQLKVNLTSAYQNQMRSVSTLTRQQQQQQQQQQQHQQQQQMVPQNTTLPSETGAIRYPIMHSAADTKNRSQINSVKPFLINGQQSGELLEYDNVDEKPLQQTTVKSVEAVSGYNVTSKGSGDTTRQTTGQGTIPVTFDTFVTLGRPSDSSVTFDTFVTLGRPYATSTPVPNGNVSYAPNLGQEFVSHNKYDRSHELRSTGTLLASVSEQSPMFTGVSGQFPTTVTQSWNYSAGAQQSTAVPIAVQSGTKLAQEPATMHTPSFPVSLDSHVTSQGSVSGPYVMDNRSYGKLTSPPYAFITTVPVSAAYTQATNIPIQVSHSVSRSNDQLQGQPSRSQDKVRSPGSPFKEYGSFQNKESPDYDDETVFSDLVARLSPVTQERSRSARRKLEFEGSSHNGQVVTSCVPQLNNHELNHDELNHNYTGYPKVQAVPGVTQQRSMTSPTSNMNESMSFGDRSDADAILDLVYITERIISMSFASEEHETTYKYNLKEVTRMLKTKHQDNYLVINISDKRPELAKLCPQVLDYGWPENLAPPLERLCSICKAIDGWMGSNPNNVVVVHCKGGRGRIAVVIAAYMRYSNICASADQALDRFAMKRFYDDKLGGLPQPSQRRYVHYFAGLLSGAIQINSSALYLHHILIHGVPNFDTRGGCRPFIKVYQGMHPIFTSGVYNVTDNMQKVCISISPGIPLRGDILIKCYHKKNKAGQREIMWGCQFHTCAISHNSLVFSKNELDYGINDPRFPDPGKVEFVFGNNSEGLVQVADFKSDVTVPVDDSTDALTRWDSYENFGKAGTERTDANANGLQSSTDGVDSFRVTQLDHSQGPVDGSLYAQINKRKLESQIVQNGPTKLQNGGSYTSSVDSGISAFSAPMGMSTTQKSSNESWSYRTQERDHHTTQQREHYVHQPNMSSSFSSKSYSSTSTSPRGKVALDEQAQLDKILSELLDDKAFITTQTSQSGKNVNMKFKEDVMSPEGTMVTQRGDVTYKVPDVRQEKHVAMKSESKTVIEDKSYKPVNAFTYTPSSPEMSRSFEPIKSPGSPKVGRLPYKADYENRYQKESYSHQSNGPSSLSDSENMSWLQQQQAKLREKSVERDPNRAVNERMMLEELKTTQAQNKLFQKRSKSEDETVKSPSSTANGPGGYSYTVSRTHTYNGQDKPDSGFNPTGQPISHSHTTYITEHTSQSSSKVSNKPPPSPGLQRSVAAPVSAPVPPPQRTSSKDYMHQQQTSTVQSAPPPAPARNRTYSGGNAYQSSSSSSWKTETHGGHQPRSMTRAHSDRGYDSEVERQTAPLSYTSPTRSPRSVSPHTYQSYKTVYKTIERKDEPDFVKPVEENLIKQIQQSQQSVQQSQHVQQEQQKPHYITEVIVQRTGGADSKSSTLNRSSEQEKKETENRLEALEKTLQAATNSIISTSPWQQQQQQKQIMQQQETRSYETRLYETKSEHREERQQQERVSRRDGTLPNGGGYPRSMSPGWDNVGPSEHVQQVHQEPLPPPKKLEVTEEDRITLKPIGPGVHQLEPEGSHTGTLSRDGSSTLGRTTPSFPTSPTASAEHIIQAVHEKVRRMSLGSNQSLNSIGYHAAPPLATPPFPVSPRTPYQNYSVSTGSYQAPGFAPRHPSGPTGPYGYGSSVTGPYSSQQSLNSVFERDPASAHYNTIVSRQLMHSEGDPTYASINDNEATRVKGGGHVIGAPAVSQQQQEKMQYSQMASQQYQTQTLPHGVGAGQGQGGAGMQAFSSSTLPHQPSYQQQQNQQNQQQSFQKQSYQQSSSSSQQWSSSSNQQQQYKQDGSLHVDTNTQPRMMLQNARSPSSPGSPPSPGNLNTLRQQLHIAHNMSGNAVSPGPHSATGQSSPSVYFGLSRRGSLTSLVDSEAVTNTPKFVKDTSKFWYKPNITREEAIMLLKDKMPGTFVVRDSNSFPGAFGLALKVATLPPNVQTKTTGDPLADLVRHFLIEPTSKGVRLRGCSNEPVFGSLASLVYQHSITPLALPCKLVLPDHGMSSSSISSSARNQMASSSSTSYSLDPHASLQAEQSMTTEAPSSASALLAQGAACNVIFLNTVDTESLTGPQAVAKACKMTFDNPPPKTTVVHFKVSNQGITLTDNQRKLFFRRHYPVAAVTYCGMDPEDRKWRRPGDVPGTEVEVKVFGFIARKQGSISDNACHLFAEMDPDQPASAIVNFVTKIMIGQGKIKS